MKKWLSNFEFWLHCKGWSFRAIRCKLAYFIYPHFYPAPFDIGQEVRDDLTRKNAKVVGLGFMDGKTWTNDKQVNSMRCWAVYLDNDYLDGGRHPWEVTDLKRGY